MNNLAISNYVSSKFKSAKVKLRCAYIYLFTILCSLHIVYILHTKRYTLLKSLRYGNGFFQKLFFFSFNKKVIFRWFSHLKIEKLGKMEENCKICLIEVYLLKYYFERHLIYRWRYYRQTISNQLNIMVPYIDIIGLCHSVAIL